ncbi:MAG TPA: hypothetical protein DF613_11565 [Lachnospiraceae bacterium]|nr:hypothetical protein [Lachnospiraceae bacterium]
MLHLFMNRDYFYFGIVAAGILGLVSMLLTNQFYHRILSDLPRMNSPKGKWMRAFLSSMDERAKLNQKITNSEVFIRSKLEEGRILKIGIGTLSSFHSLMTLLAAACTGLAVYDTFLVKTDMLVRLQYLAGGVAVCALLLLLYPLFGIAFKEERILDSLADYIENRTVFTGQEKKTSYSTAGNSDAMMNQVMEGIRQTAAAGTKFSGLLTEEEEEVLRDVIREYLV